MKESIVNAFIDAISKYFETHKDAKTFEIDKGALAYLSGLGLTSTETLCQGIATETASLKNLRGKITVDREGWIEWKNLRYQVKIEAAKTENEKFYAKQQAYGPERELQRVLYERDLALRKLEEKKALIPKVEAQTKAIKEETARLKTPQEIDDEKMQAWREARERERDEAEDEEYYG